MTEYKKLANPAPLGLAAFGITTVLLNIHNAGFYDLGAMILAMGIFYGGLAQVIAGVLEYQKGNTFGVTAFTSYGLFWLSLVAIIILPHLIPSITSPDKEAMTAYLFIWGLFTALMFISSLTKPTALQFVFLSLTVLFWLLALGEITQNTTITTIAGYEGIICGLSAIYLAMAEVINENYQKNIVPIGAPFFKK